MNRNGKVNKEDFWDANAVAQNPHAQTKILLLMGEHLGRRLQAFSFHALRTLLLFYLFFKKDKFIYFNWRLIT